MIIPLTHDKMTVQRAPWITILVIATNVIVFLMSHPRAQRDEQQLYEIVQKIQGLAQRNPEIRQGEFGSDEAYANYRRLMDEFNEANRNRLFGRYGFVPQSPEWRDVLSSMFLHGSWMHLLGNLYLLWLCGCSIEDHWGRPTYIVIFVASGLAACLAHAAAFPDSPTPLVGASGAISGLMGAFLVRLYATRIRFFYMIWIHWGTFFAPAWVMLPLWLLSQVFYALAYSEGSAVAFWAHVGGFLVGASLALFIKWTLLEEAFLAPAIEQKTSLFTQSPHVSTALHLIEADRYTEAILHLQRALREDPDDVDALDLLAGSFRSLGRHEDAGRAYARKLRSHLKRRERDLAAAAYSEMLEVSSATQVPARDLLALAPALIDSDRHREAEEIYEHLVDSATEPVLHLRAALALADLYLESRRGDRALQLLRSVAPLIETHPEWRPQFEQRMNAGKLSGERVSAIVSDRPVAAIRRDRRSGSRSEE